MPGNVIYVVSPGEMSGKSTVIMSLAMKAMEMGQKVGYFKPVGAASMVGSKGELVDEDAKTMRDILGLKDEAGLLCPVVLEKYEFLHNYDLTKAQGCRDRVLKAFRDISEGRDLILVEGPNSLSVGYFLGCQVTKLAAEFNAKLLLVSRVRGDFFLDELLMAKDYCERSGVLPFGVILNRVSGEDAGKMKKIVRPYLEKVGLDLLGAIPNNEVLAALRVREIYESIGGKLLAGKDGMDNLVQTVLVGAMSMESAMRYFRRSTNSLVIVGGDRTDVASAALETKCSAIVLTGNIHPSVKILPRADELNIPIILVPHDTYGTLQAVQRIVGKIRPGDRMRIELARKLFEENVQWEKILG